MIHDGEQLVLRDARLDRFAHRGDGGLRAGHRDLQAFHLLRRLDGAHGQNLALAIPDLAAALFQRQRLQMAAAVEPELHRAAAMRLQEIGDLVGEGTGRLVVAARHRRPDQLGRPRLVDRVEHHRDMIALRIFEQDDRPFRRNEEIARRVAQEIAEHVARAGGIALVVGIEQHDARHSRPRASRSRSFFRRSLPQRIRIDEGRLGIGQPHAAGRVRRRRMAHAVVEIDILDAVGIENDDAHDETLAIGCIGRCWVSAATAAVQLSSASVRLGSGSPPSSPLVN